MVPMVLGTSSGQETKPNSLPSWTSGTNNEVKHIVYYAIIVRKKKQEWKLWHCADGLSFKSGGQEDLIEQVTFEEQLRRDSLSLGWLTEAVFCRKGAEMQKGRARKEVSSVAEPRLVGAS